MTVLTLGYRCCDRKLPKYIKHPEVEGIAVQARRQLVDDTTDAIGLPVLRDISKLKINGVEFDLWVDTEHQVSDEQGQPVLGVCEVDPGASPNAAMLSVSPAVNAASQALVLSTFAHELGHAVFDAPAWIVAAANDSPGLFDDHASEARRAYRTTTRDAEHLAKAAAVRNTELEKSIHFAELRANEFMGSLLVPRQLLCRAIEELAPMYDVTIHRSPSLDPDFPGMALKLSVEGGVSAFDMESLQKALGKHFGVNRRFIQVRMERYGLLTTGAGIT
jgi:hypothetical protein